MPNKKVKLRDLELTKHKQQDKPPPYPCQEAQEVSPRTVHCKEGQNFK